MKPIFTVAAGPAARVKRGAAEAATAAAPPARRERRLIIRRLPPSLGVSAFNRRASSGNLVGRRNPLQQCAAHLVGDRLCDDAPVVEADENPDLEAPRGLLAVAQHGVLDSHRAGPKLGD